MSFLEWIKRRKVKAETLPKKSAEQVSFYEVEKRLLTGRNKAHEKLGIKIFNHTRVGELLGNLFFNKYTRYAKDIGQVFVDDFKESSNKERIKKYGLPLAFIAAVYAYSQIPKKVEPQTVQDKVEKVEPKNNSVSTEEKRLSTRLEYPTKIKTRLEGANGEDLLNLSLNTLSGGERLLLLHHFANFQTRLHLRTSVRVEGQRGAKVLEGTQTGFEFVKTRLSKTGLPETLKELAPYLVVAESGYNENATSNAGALGPWQFTPETGVRFGLSKQNNMKEFRDLRASTEAAIKYFEEMGKKFMENGEYRKIATKYKTSERFLSYIILNSYNSGFSNVVNILKMINGGFDNYRQVEKKSKKSVEVKVENSEAVSFYEKYHEEGFGGYVERLFKEYGEDGIFYFMSQGYLLGTMQRGMRVAEALRLKEDVKTVAIKTGGYYGEDSSDYVPKIMAFAKLDKLKTLTHPLQIGRVVDTTTISKFSEVNRNLDPKQETHIDNILKKLRSEKGVAQILQDSLYSRFIKELISLSVNDGYVLLRDHNPSSGGERLKKYTDTSDMQLNFLSSLFFQAVKGKKLEVVVYESFVVLHALRKVLKEVLESDLQIEDAGDFKEKWKESYKRVYAFLESQLETLSKSESEVTMAKAAIVDLKKLAIK